MTKSLWANNSLKAKQKTTENNMYTRVQNVWHGWPVYEVKCLCSRGQVLMKEGGLPLPPEFQYLILVI